MFPAESILRVLAAGMNFEAGAARMTLAIGSVTGATAGLPRDASGGSCVAP